MKQILKSMTKKEWLLWSCSVIIILISNLAAGRMQFVTIAAPLIGVTSLILAAKGNVWAQVLMVIFSILYGIASWQCRYWGEMLTYLGMTMPMAIFSIISWSKNPSAEGGGEVQIQKLGKKQVLEMLALAVVVTTIFYFILRYFNTPNLALSTVSITTSFLAAYLTFMRSSYYAMAYALNDCVLIFMWILMSMEDMSYLPMIFNFLIFLVNDLYGFRSWKKREIAQGIE